MELIFILGTKQIRRCSNNLCTRQIPKKWKEFLIHPVELAKFDIIFFTTFVVLRFRNNIFHGNKYARNWMKYKDQIIHCTEIMQLFISHADSIRKSKNADATA